MIVIERKDGTVERISGNPTLTSLDGTERAPLKTILSASWSEKARARFGIHVVEHPETPEGKMRDGAVRYEKQGESVVAVADFVNVPVPDTPPAPSLDERLAEFEARIAALEGKR